MCVNYEVEVFPFILLLLDILEIGSKHCNSVRLKKKTMEKEKSHLECWSRTYKSWDRILENNVCFWVTMLL